MLGVVLKLVPALSWSSGLEAQQHVNHEQIAITSCISAVKSYFPCSTTPTPDYACLCGQYLWRVACFENHASGPLAHADRASTKRDASDVCRAAGSVEADKVKREHARQKRQIGDLLSSIVGDVSSVLSSKGVTVLTAVIESVAGGVVNALPTRVNPTSIAAEITAISAVGEGEGSTISIEAVTSSLSSTGNTASGASLRPTSSSPSSSSAAASPTNPDSDQRLSAGLIAGVVVGAIAALALIGIFILLLLRYRRKNKYEIGSRLTDKEASPTTSSSSFHHPGPQPTISSPALTPAVLPPSTYAASQRPEAALLSPISPISPTEQAPWASSQSTFVGGTLPRYSSSSFDNSPPQPHHFLDSKTPRSSEMPTAANAWELDGREIPRSSELDVGRKDQMGACGAQSRHREQAYVTYRRPSIDDSHSGEFVGNQPVGRAL